MRLKAGMNLACHPAWIVDGFFAFVCDNWLVGPDGQDLSFASAQGAAVADDLEPKVDELALEAARETGNAVRTQARPEARQAIDFFRYFGGVASEFKGEAVPHNDGLLNYTLRQPLGVIGGIAMRRELAAREEGRVVAFDFDPIHRYQTQSDFRLAWNVILNWNDLPPEPTVQGGTYQTLPSMTLAKAQPDDVLQATA